jgi:flagellar basal-body rod protein FlgF
MSDTIQAISKSLSADIATLNAISHNIANSNTAGFRAERAVPSFQSQVGSDGSVTQTGGGQGSTVSIDQQDGAISDTGRSLDLALRGEGFFAVQHGSEMLLVRAGGFRLDTEGHLVNANGDRVLGESGEISLEKEAVRIDDKGQIWSGEESLGQLKLVNVADPSRLVPVEGGFRYDGEVGEWKGKVMQGAIEHTNVNVADESIRLMELTRHVESVQRAISIYDKAMDTGINRLGE